MIKHTADKILCVVLDVNVQLGVGDLNAVLVKGSLDVLNHIMINCPVIGGLCPYSHSDIHRACAKVRYSCERCKCARFLYCQGVSADNAVDDVNSLAEILLVGNAEHQINTAFVLTAEIGYSSAGDHAVRDIYYFIVKSNKLC